MNVIRRRTRKQVCLFGLSGDPPTNEGGHVGIVKALLSLKKTIEEDNDNEIKSFLFDEIRIVPVYQHNYSSKRDRLVKFEDRINMCKLAFEGIQADVDDNDELIPTSNNNDNILDCATTAPAVVVSDAEKLCYEKYVSNLPDNNEKPTVSGRHIRVGTADLLDYLIEKEPNVDFTFALGTDTFLDLSTLKWKRSRDVFKLLEGRFIVFIRKEDDEKQQQQHQDESKRRNIHDIVKSFNTGDVSVVDDDNNNSCISSSNGLNMKCNIRLLNVPALDAISSSMARDCTSEKSLKHFVTTNVMTYIRDNHMYGFSTKD